MMRDAKCVQKTCAVKVRRINTLSWTDAPLLPLWLGEIHMTKSDVSMEGNVQFG